VLVAVHLLSAWSCAYRTQHTGVARVHVSCLKACGDVARVTVRISPGDGTSFAPFTKVLTSSGPGSWDGRITGIPVGVGRLFEVMAAEADGGLLLTGSARSDIVEDAAALVSILLQAGPGFGWGNAVPVIDSLSVSRDVVAPGGSVTLIATAHDPDRDPISFLWRSTCGTFDSPGSASPHWTAPSSDGPCVLRLTVTDDKGAAVTAAVTVTVTSQLGNADVTVRFSSWPVIDRLQGDILLAATATEGDMSANAHSPDGDPISYAWTSTCTGLVFDFAAPYSPTQPHFTIPAPSAGCSITVTVSTAWSAPNGTTATVVIQGNPGVTNLCTNTQCSAGQKCDPADGRCKPDGTDPCAGVVCQAPDLCSIAGTCQAGVCSPSTPRCPAGQSCNPADGSCTPIDPCAGVICQPIDLCHDAGTCSSGTCSVGAVKTCPSGTCDPRVGCPSGALVPRPAFAKLLPLAYDSAGPGIALGPDGTAFVAGSFQGTVTFDSLPSLVSQGGNDYAVVSLDPVSHLASWAMGFGGGAGEGAQPTQQTGRNVVVTASGVVVAGGSTTGGLSGVGVSLPPAGTQEFLLGLDSRNGNVVFAKAFSIGTGGTLLSIATNGNRIAVCGFTNAAAAPATLVTGGGKNGGLKDVIVAVLDGSTGNLVWGKQLGSASDEECDSVTIDDAGNVIAAGKYNRQTATAATLDPGLGQLPDPNGTLSFSSARRHIWMAKYDPTGTPLYQAHFGQGNGNHAPAALSADASGNVIVAGSFNDVLPFGTTTLSTTPNATGTANSQDAFIAKLNPDLTAAWAVSFGGTGTESVNGVAATSTGEIVAVGNFASPTMTGTGLIVQLSNAQSSGTTSDAYLVKLDGAGNSQFSAAYGDLNQQSGARVAVNRKGTSQLDLVGFTGGYESGSASGQFGFPPLNVLDVASNFSYLVFAPLAP
jgi:hypothetical protein